MEQAYIDVIVEGVLSTTVWAFTSDITYSAMLAFGQFDLLKATWCAIAGASIGSSINFALGWLLSLFQYNGLSVISQTSYDKWRRYAFYAAPFIAAVSSFQLVGALVMGLGFLRLPAYYVIPLLIAGQAGYYFFVYGQAVGG